MSNPPVSTAAHPAAPQVPPSDAPPSATGPHDPTTGAGGPLEDDRPSLAGDVREIVGDIWRYRDLLYQLARRDVRIRYKQAMMGFAWALFMPSLIVLSGLLVRFAIAYVTGRQIGTGTVAAIAVKAVPWGFFVSAIGFATSSLIANSTLVTKIYFPRELLPLSAVLAAAFDALIGGTAVAIALLFLGVTLSTGLLWVPLLLGLLFLFTVAASLFLSCANLFFRDVKYIVQVVLTFGIFFTPVIFDAAMFGPVAGPLIMLNPLAPLLEGLRLAVVEGWNLLTPLEVVARGGGTVPAWSPWYLAYSALWAIGGLLVSAVVFHRSELLFAEYV
jgi:ABC-type polysaccharide/polyol phosphate export permease